MFKAVEINVRLKIVVPDKWKTMSKEEKLKYLKKSYDDKTVIVSVLKIIK